MSSGKPVVRQIAWMSIVPQLFIMGILVLIFHLFVKPFKSALILAIITYLAVSLILRRCVPHHQSEMAKSALNMISSFESEEDDIGGSSAP